MNEPHLNGRGYNEFLMQVNFRSDNPCLANFPHCLFHASQTALSLMAQELNVGIGIWGAAEQEVDATGNPYLPDEFTAEDFVLWELPDNRIHALRYAAAGSGASLVVAIDSQTPAWLLSEMNGKLPRLADADRFEYLYCLNWLCQWIDDLGWAYITLDCEYGFAMFVTSQEFSHLVGRVKEQLDQNGIHTFSLKTKAGYFEWPDGEI